MPRKNTPPADGMQRIHWSISTDNVGSKCSGYFDIEVDATDVEIEEQAKDAAFDHMEWTWTREGED